MPGFDPRQRSRILSLSVSGSPASHLDSIPLFCFSFSSIVPKFYPFLFRVLQHSAPIHIPSFVSGSPASRLNLISLFCFRFSDIAPGFESLLLFQVLQHPTWVENFVPQHLHLSYGCHTHPSFSYSTVRALLGLVGLRALGGLVCGPLSAYVVHFEMSLGLFLFSFFLVIGIVSYEASCNAPKIP